MDDLKQRLLRLNHNVHDSPPIPFNRDGAEAAAALDAKDAEIARLRQEIADAMGLMDDDMYALAYDCLSAALSATTKE